jgi:predicted permease
VAHLLGLKGAAFQAGVLQASMPTAVVTTILALEFDVAELRDERRLRQIRAYVARDKPAAAL